MLQAVTFDLWDTLFIDDSDEPRRAALGLAPKAVARRDLFVNVVVRHHPAITHDQAANAWEDATSWFNVCWKREHHTPTVATRLDKALTALGLERPPGFGAMVDALERMELDIPPELAPGAAEAVAALAGRFRLGVISDAVVTPGRNLRQLLRHYGLFDHFSAFVFSDEAGASKPSPVVFHKAAAALGVPLDAMAHVGDRESNDVSGPRSVGMKAVLYTGVIDRGSGATRADLVCRHLDTLESLLATL